MFKRSFTSSSSSKGTKDRVGKISKQQPKRSFREETKQKILENLDSPTSVGRCVAPRPSLPDVPEY